MTGRFSIRSGTHSVPIGGGLEGLTQWEVTIAELLSDAGYSTGAFGKWHPRRGAGGSGIHYPPPPTNGG